jgi:hypothetical protein
MPRELKVALVADARPFNNTLDAAIGKVTGFKKRLETTGGGSLTKGLAIGAGVASFNLLTSAISAGVGAMDEMHQAFLDDEASQARLQNVLKNTVSNYDEAIKQAEDFAAAQAALGFTDDSVRDSQEQLVGMTKNLAEANNLVTLSEDIARAKNIDLAQATDVVTKAYAGQARGLTALGINTQGQTGRTALLAAAWNNVRGAVDKYATIGAGKVAAANAKMDQTMEKLGGAIDKISQVVIPVMVAGFGAIVDASGEIIAALTNVYNFVAGYLGPAFDKLALGIGVVADALGNLRGIAATIGNGLVPGSIGSGGGGGGTPGVIQIPKTGSVNIGKFGGSFASGGVVPGSGPTLIMAHGGERITPAGEKAGQTIIVNIASFIGSDRDIDRFADRLAFRLRSTALG